MIRLVGDIRLTIKKLTKIRLKKLLNSIVTLENYVDDSCIVEDLTSSNLSLKADMESLKLITSNAITIVLG